MLSSGYFSARWRSVYITAIVAIISRFQPLMNLFFTRQLCESGGITPQPQHVCRYFHHSAFVGSVASCKSSSLHSSILLMVASVALSIPTRHPFRNIAMQLATFGSSLRSRPHTARCIAILRILHDLMAFWIFYYFFIGLTWLINLTWLIITSWFSIH